MTEPPLIGLLDERSLEGAVDLRCALGPPMCAEIVANDDFAAAVSTVRRLCQSWGGAAYRIYAVERGDGDLPAEFTEDQALGAVSVIGGCGVLGDGFNVDTRHDLHAYAGSGVGGFLLPILLDSGATDALAVGCVDVDLENPWTLAYFGALGDLQREPFPPHLLQRLQLRPGLTWEEVIDIVVERPEQPNASDLLARLRDPRLNTPARLSCSLLGLPTAPRNMGPFGDHESPFPAPWAERALVGPNVVVVYEPGAVSDLALLWNLRAAHGLPRGFPLAVPVTEDVPAVLDTWLSEYAYTPFGAGGSREPRLVSTTVETATLEEIASNAPGYIAAPWRDFRQVGRRPARLSLRIAEFRNGKARVPAWTDQDRIQLGDSGSDLRRPKLKLTAALTTRTVPPLRSLRPEWVTHPGYWEWGYQRDDPGPTKLANIRWPAGWAVLQAALKDRGLRGEPSGAGLSAASLLRRIGSGDGLAMLLDSAILTCVHDLATAKSMTWFRDRARDIAHSAADPADGEQALEAIERRLAEMTVRPDDEEQPLITADKLRQLLNRNRSAVTPWLRWAEDSSLLVRGVQVTCSNCGAKPWLPVAELAPPVTCRGCGEDVAHPYPDGELKFRYRAGEPLLRAVEEDCLSHLLALRFFLDLFRPSFDTPSYLYGGYPGVDIYEIGRSNRIGEADVLLVLASGELVPGECKRRGNGLNPGELSKLETLEDRLDAPWSFLATPDWADDCPTIWKDSVRNLPQRPRFSLTAEQLFAWPTTSQTQLLWEPATAEERQHHHERFVERLVNPIFRSEW